MSGEAEWVTFVFGITVLVLIFVVLRRWREGRRSDTKEERRARAERFRRQMAELHARETGLAERTIVLEYVGGHPALLQPGICRVRRDAQERTVEITIGHQRLEVDTSTVVGATLLRPSGQEALATDPGRRSGARDVAAHSRLGSPSRGRPDRADKARREMLVWTLSDGTRVLFRDSRHRPLGDWYMQARSILERRRG